MSEFNIKKTFRIDSKLDKFIKLGKDSLNIFQLSNVAYKIVCLNCDKCYVGVTGRLLSTRTEENHDNFIYNPKNHKVIAKHKVNPLSPELI